MKLKILGVMTGTSCDGLDASWVEVDQNTWKPRWHASRPFDSHLRKQILRIQKPGTRVSLKELLYLERDLSEWYGKTLRSILSRRGLPHLIANHGQTIAHHPSRNDRVTFQLGDPSRIAYLTKTTVVSHFRNGDIASGGVAAPFAPRYHQFLAQRLFGSPKGISFLNLGGFANITYMKDAKSILAFDTGPANIWIDAAIEQMTRGKESFDRGGLRALSGLPDPKSLKKLKKHPYLLKGPPKSTGRDDFPSDWFFKKAKVKKNDLVATAAQFSVETIVDGYQRWILNKKLPLKKIVVCGGGAKNRFLLRGIQKKLLHVDVLPIDRLSIPSESIESQAFAYFAFRSLKGLPIGGSWTGLKGFAPPAWITPGENWSSVLKALKQF